jgi:hypothetical protein
MNPIYVATTIAISAAITLAIIHETTPAQPADTESVETYTVVPKSEPPLSHPVRTIPMTASPLVAPIIPVIIPPPVILATAPDQPVIHPAPKKQHDDICARHGGHRVDDGRKWHCAYARR